MPPGTSTLVLWMPVTMTRPDGRTYTLFVYYQRHYGDGWSTGSAQGAIELSDGRRKAFRDIVPQLAFEDGNRRLIGGDLRCVNADGTERVAARRAGLGHRLPPRAPGSTAGSRATSTASSGATCTSRASTSTAATRSRWPIASTSTATASWPVTDTSDGSTGVGSLQSIVAGPHPELGLTEDASFD